MRVCGARSWTPQGCIRKTDRYRAVLVAWWVSVARALTMPPTHCGPVISLHPCRCGAIVIVDVVCCGPVAIPAVGVHACARAIRSDPDGWDAAAVLQGVGHQIVQNPLQRITLALADRLAVVLEQLDGAIDTRAANSSYSLRAPVSASSWLSCIYPFAPVSGVRMSCESADRSRWNRCCSRACSARSRSAASSSALTLRAISLSPVSGALVFSRAAERGSRRDSARAMRRSSRAYRPCWETLRAAR